MPWGHWDLTAVPRTQWLILMQGSALTSVSSKIHIVYHMQLHFSFRSCTTPYIHSAIYCIFHCHCYICHGFSHKSTTTTYSRID